MTTDTTTKLLFVCLGNICRSPAAENVMRHLIRSNEVEEHFVIDSAGTANYHTGKGPDPRMVRAGQSRGIPMPGSARQVSQEDFRRFDWIFAMDQNNLRDLRRLQSQVTDSRARLVLFCDFCEKHDQHEVPDPYYGGEDGFHQVLDLLEDGCSVILQRWRDGRLA